jgi:hypothetical protein
MNHLILREIFTAEIAEHAENKNNEFVIPAKAGTRGP